MHWPFGPLGWPYCELHGTGTCTSVTTYASVPFWNTCASTPLILALTPLPSSVVSAASQMGSTRISELVVSLPHQSLESSAMVLPCGCALTTLRASVSSLTTFGADGFVK